MNAVKMQLLYKRIYELFYNGKIHIKFKNYSGQAMGNCNEK